MYGEDLSWLHHVGFGDFAAEAAPEVLRMLRTGGIVTGRIVELGCGSGILLRQLLEAGFDVVGVDASPAMIHLAATAAPAARVIAGRAGKIEIPACSAVVAQGEVFNYQQDGVIGNLAEILDRIAVALQPRGLLLFDALVDLPETPWSDRYWTAGEDWTVLVAVEGNPDHTAVNREVLMFRREGDLWRKSEETHRLQVFSVGEIESALHHLGFSWQMFRGWGGVDLPPGRRMFLARRV